MQPQTKVMASLSHSFSLTSIRTGTRSFVRKLTNSARSCFLSSVFIRWYCFLGVCYSSLPFLLHLHDPFSPGRIFFIVLYQAPKRGHEHCAMVQPPLASPRVSIRAKPQTTQHENPFIFSFVLTKKCPDSVPISFPPFLFVLSLPPPVWSLDSPIRHHGWGDRIRLHCFNSLRSPHISLRWSAYLSICVKPG